MHTCTDCWVDLSTLHHSCKASLHKHLYTTIDDQYGSTFPVINHTFITHSNTELPIDTQVAFSSPYMFCPILHCFYLYRCVRLLPDWVQDQDIHTWSCQQCWYICGSSLRCSVDIHRRLQIRTELLIKRHKSHHIFNLYIPNQWMRALIGYSSWRYPTIMSIKVSVNNCQNMLKIDEIILDIKYLHDSWGRNVSCFFGVQYSLSQKL